MWNQLSDRTQKNRQPWQRWSAIACLLMLLGLGFPQPADASRFLSAPIAFGLIGQPRFAMLPSDRVDEISVEKISQFIQAYLQVIQLLQSHQAELRHTDAAPVDLPNEATEIEQAALQQIEAAGLTRQEYLQLLNLANSDPDFSDRIAMQLQEFNPD